MNIGHTKGSWPIEVSNVNLNTCTDEQWLLINQYLQKHHVVIIRDQELSQQRQVELCEKIGHVPKYPEDDTRFDRMKTAVNGIARVTGAKDSFGRPGLFEHKHELGWHCSKPSLSDKKDVVWLYAVKGTRDSTTSWLNTYLAYQDLSNEIKAELEDKTVFCGYKSGSYSTSQFFKDHVNLDLPVQIVRKNSIGQKGLYFPFLQIFESNLSKESFDDLVNFITNKRYIYDHHWQDGDVVLSEQYFTLHKRWAFEAIDERLLYRITYDFAKMNSIACTSTILNQKKKSQGNAEGNSLKPHPNS